MLRLVLLATVERAADTLDGCTFNLDANWRHTARDKSDMICRYKNLLFFSVLRWLLPQRLF